MLLFWVPLLVTTQTLARMEAPAWTEWMHSPAYAYPASLGISARQTWMSVWVSPVRMGGPALTTSTVTPASALRGSREPTVKTTLTNALTGEWVHLGHQQSAGRESWRRVRPGPTLSTVLSHCSDFERHVIRRSKSKVRGWKGYWDRPSLLSCYGAEEPSILFCSPMVSLLTVDLKSSFFVDLLPLFK